MALLDMAASRSSVSAILGLTAQTYLSVPLSAFPASVIFSSWNAHQDP